MSCCDEHGCKRKQPIALYLGDFSGQVFAATRARVVKDHGDGTATLSASEKHDVTAQMRRFIRKNPEWVRAVLAEAERPPGVLIGLDETLGETRDRVL